MVSDYHGHFIYSKASVSKNAPDACGVYKIGHLKQNGNLKSDYIGMSATSIRDRLLDHLNNDKWSDVTHFGYHTCDTEKEAKDFEAAEIKRCGPKYNK